MKRIQINKILITGLMLGFIFCIGHLGYGDKDKMEEIILADTVNSAKTLSKGDTIKKPQLTQVEKIEDFNYLYRIIIDDYPYLEVNKRVYDTSWEEQGDLYIKRVKETHSDEEFFGILCEILKDLHNGHTHMIESEWVQYMRAVYNPKNGCSGWQTMNFDAINQDLVLQRYDISVKENQQQAEVSIPNMEPLQVEVQDIIEDKIGYIYIPQMTCSSKMERWRDY